MAILGKKTAIFFAGVIFLTVLGSWWFQYDAAATHITVYKRANCNCCNKWIERLRQNGFNVKAGNVNSLQTIKSEYGIPQTLASCHTALVEGYVVEGHVPADSIHRLLFERPQVQGIAVPKMPAGSPGMEGPDPIPYDVLTFDGSGKIIVYDQPSH